MVTRGLLLSSHSHSLASLLWGKPATIWEMPYGETHVTGNWGKTPAMAHKELQSLGQQSTRNWILPHAWAWRWLLPQLSLRCDSGPGWHLECYSVRPWASGNQLSCACTPDPHKLWDGVCCKTLGFREIGDTVVDCEYSLLPGFRLCFHASLLPSISSEKPTPHSKSDNTMVSLPYLNP